MRDSSGLLLAATVAEGDAEATAQAALVPALAERVSAEAQALAARPRDHRRALIRRYAAALRAPARADAPLPARGRALLAAEMPRDIGRIWLQAAPKPRRGYAAPTALRDVLRRASREARPRDAESAEAERGSGRELLARRVRTADEPERAALLQAIGAEDAAAVLALEQLVGDVEAPLAAEVDASVVRAVLASPGLRAADRPRAMGAMARGWLGHERDGGDAWSRPFWRAGREMRELMEAGCHA